MKFMNKTSLILAALAALAFLTALARRLTASGDEAEDLVQELWTKSISRELFAFATSDETIAYDGSQLRAHWILRATGLVGDAVVAFRGPCKVADREMADLGVTELITVPWFFSGADPDSCEEKCEGIRLFGEKVIAELDAEEGIA